MKIGKARAGRLWSDLRENFLSAESLVIKIIEAEAWVPLGYDDFASAWMDQMKGVRLATDLARAEVIYQMFGSPLSDTEIAAAVTGASIETVKRLRTQHKAGVPAELAQVRGHVRGLPEAPYRLILEFTHDQIMWMNAIAQRTDETVKTVAADAVIERFRKMERARRRAS